MKRVILFVVVSFLFLTGCNIESKYLGKIEKFELYTDTYNHLLVLMTLDDGKKHLCNVDGNSPMIGDKVFFNGLYIFWRKQ